MMPFLNSVHIDPMQLLTQFKDRASQIAFDGGQLTWITRMKFLGIAAAVNRSTSSFLMRSSTIVMIFFHLVSCL